MLRDVFLLGERLAGTNDARLRRGLVFAFFEALAVAAPYALTLSFVRSALEHQLSMTMAWEITAGIVFAVLLRLVCSRGSMSNIFIAAHSLMGQTRIRAADHLRHLPMGFFTQKRSGELASVLTSDVALVEDVWSHTIGIFAASFALPMLVGAGLCFLDWRLGLIVLGSLPLALAVLALTTPIFVKEIEAVLDASANASARIVELVQGIAVVRAFGRYGEIYQRLVKALERLRDALIRSDVLPSPLLAVFGLVIELSFVTVALAGSRRLLHGAIQPRVLLVFLIVTVGVLRQVADLGVALLMLRASQRALGRVERLLDEKPLTESDSAPGSIRHFDVEVDGVSFAYGDEAVLHGVSTKFAARSLTALVGASGSGKSTLVHLLARLWDVPRASGAIRIGGIDIRELPFEALHRHIAMVFQDVVLFSGTILENIRVGRPDASRDEVEVAARAAQAHDFISALPAGYETELGEGGGTLSGGERQRISIARAFLKDAPIVLLDEATASVDASSEAELQRAIDSLVQSKTVVVIAHRLRTVRRADRIVVLDRGRIVESGTHDELIANSAVYAALWREQERAKGWRLAPRP